VLSRLSAEPLVGLKLGAARAAGGRPMLSAEPLVGLKHQRGPIARTSALSAEPLVGLKRAKRDSYRWGVVLSAEPLVGLKRSEVRDLSQLGDPFSRTPRGFEAILTRKLMPGGSRLSAEPLVGLKRSQGVPTRGKRTFSRTPRGFEAPHPLDPRDTTGAFSRTPRGFEADLSEDKQDALRFQPNPSWV